MIQSFCTWLTTLISGLTVGSNLTLGYFKQDSAALCTAVMERTGADVMDIRRQRRDKPIQLLTRGKSYVEARTEAFRIFETLIRQVGVELDEFTVLTVSGTEPQYLGEDDKRRHSFSANVLVRLKMEEET